MVLAGRYRPCGSLAASTAPVSRSETIHAVAEISAGTAGAAAGRTTPHSPRRLPPTGGSGIGSAVGGASPGAGTSEESMAGGGCVFCGQVSVTGVANGVVVGGGGCAAAG